MIWRSTDLFPRRHLQMLYWRSIKTWQTRTLGTLCSQTLPAKVPLSLITSPSPTIPSAYVFLGVHFIYIPRELSWHTTPRTVLIVKKPLNQQTTNAFLKTLKWLKLQGLNVIVEPQVATELDLTKVYTIPSGTRFFTRV